MSPATRVLLAATAGWSATASAQDRLVGLRAIGGGATAEIVRFGGGGLLQDPSGGSDSLRVRRATQFSLPLTVAVPLGDAWTLDVTSVLATGTVTYDVAGPRPARGETVTMSGASDVRARATGRLAGDALIVTLGANLPSGRQRLGAEQLTAVRVLAAPALGLGAPPVGAGASGTVGVLTARRVQSWAVALGASYELHGSYAPFGALVAGATTTNFRPGDVMRVSLGADGLVGRQRLSVSFSGDFFGTDRLRGTSAPVPTGSSSTPPAPVTSVRLGPELSSDAQLYLAVPGVREAVVWVSNRWRARFARDGITVDGSSGNYFDGGMRTTVPVARRADLVFGADTRWQSGLSVDDALLSAASRAFGVTAAMSARVRDGVTLQPFARAQVGHVRAGAASSAGLAGGSLGVTVLTRF